MANTLGRLLIVEDEVVQATIISRLLQTEPYTIEYASNGKQALELYQQHPFRVIITDLQMPEMSGRELIHELMRSDIKPVIIVQTIIDELNTITEVMREGAYDYVLKPLNAADLKFKIEKAFKHAELVQIKHAAEREREIRTENQILQKRLVESIIRKQGDKFDKELFVNLNTSFSQGAGIGSLTALLSLVKATAVKEGNRYYIDENLYNLILDNAKSTEAMLGMLSELEQLVVNKITYESMSAAQVYKLISAEVNSCKEFLTIRKNTFQLAEMPVQNAEVKYRINTEYFTRAVRELIINALKFSEQGTTVIILVQFYQKSLTLTVLNTPAKNLGDISGIPVDYRQMIFEPFFRLTRTVNEQYETLDYGLGLTMAAKIITLHGGKITCAELTDHFSEDEVSRRKVSFEIELPA